MVIIIIINFVVNKVVFVLNVVLFFKIIFGDIIVNNNIGINSNY